MTTDQTNTEIERLRRSGERETLEAVEQDIHSRGFVIHELRRMHQGWETMLTRGAPADVFISVRGYGTSAIGALRAAVNRIEDQFAHLTGGDG